MKNRTIRELRDSPTTKVYIQFRSDALCREFYKQAEAEGYRFGEIMPTASSPGDLIAIQDDYKLAFVGWVGHMAYQNRKAVVGGITCIDYEKYIAGWDDYLI